MPRITSYTPLVFLLMLLTPSLTAAEGLTIGTGGLTVESLPGDTGEDLAVCADSTTGKLGPCGAGSELSGVAWVAEDGTGDYDDPVAAMDDLATWCGTPSLSDPCLLMIAPGYFTVYEPIELVDWVTIRGSGPRRTIIRRPPSVGPGIATIVTNSSLGDEARLENLSIWTTSATTNRGAYLDHSSSLPVVFRNVSFESFSAEAGTNIGVTVNAGKLRMEDVEIKTGGNGLGQGLVVAGSSAIVVSDRLTIDVRSNDSAVTGIKIDDVGTLTANNTRIRAWTSSSSLEAIGIHSLHDVTAGDDLLFSGLQISILPNTGGGRGVYLQTAGSGALRLHDAEIDATGTSGTTYGVFTTNGADVRIESSVIRADETALYAATNDSTQWVTDTLLEGAVEVNTAPFTCRDVYEFDTLDVLDNQCQSGL